MQVARALKLELDPQSVRITVSARFSRTGSVIKGDASVACEGVEIDLSLGADASRDQLTHLVRMAEASCYTMGALRNPTPSLLRACVNGETMEIQAGS